MDGNVATISGTITRDGFADFPNFWLRVVDNGEGVDATDFVSPLVASTTVLACTTDVFDAVYPVENGNIQVR